MADIRKIEGEEEINPYGIQNSQAVNFLKDNNLIGYEKENCMSLIKSLSLNCRIINDLPEDKSKEFLLSDRINLTIENDVVVKAQVY